MVRVRPKGETLRHSIRTSARFPAVVDAYADGADTADISLWSCNGQSHQQWSLRNGAVAGTAKGSGHRAGGYAARAPCPPALDRMTATKESR